MNSFVKLTNELMSKPDFDGRENAKLCIIWTFIAHILLQNDHIKLFRYLNIVHVNCKIRTSEAKFGHDTGRRFLFVRGPTLKNYYAKTIKDRDLIFVALSF